jgi:hypothetical protein
VEKFRYAQIEGGPKLRFPAETPDEVIDRVIKEHTAVPRAMAAFGVDDAPVDVPQGSRPVPMLDATVPATSPEPGTVADTLRGGLPPPERQIHAIPGLSPGERERLLAGTATKPQVPQGDYETVAAALGPAPPVENAGVAGAPLDLLAPPPVKPPAENATEYGGEISRGLQRSAMQVLSADKGVRKYLKDSGFPVSDLSLGHFSNREYAGVMRDLAAIPAPESWYGKMAEDAPLSILLMTPALVAGAGTSAAGMGPIGALGVAALVGSVPEATVEAGTLYQTLIDQGMSPSEARKKAHLTLVDNLALLTATNMMEFGGGALVTKIGVKGVERFSKRFATTYARRAMTNITAKTAGVAGGLAASSQVEGWQEWFQEGFAQAAEGEAGVFDNTERQKEAKKMGQALGVLFGIVPAGVGVVEAGKGGMNQAFEETKREDIRKMLAGDKETMERYLNMGNEADEMADINNAVMAQVEQTPEGPSMLEEEPTETALGTEVSPVTRAQIDEGAPEVAKARLANAPEFLDQFPKVRDAWAARKPGFATSEDVADRITDEDTPVEERQRIIDALDDADEAAGIATPEVMDRATARRAAEEEKLKAEESYTNGAEPENVTSKEAAPEPETNLFGETEAGERVKPENYADAVARVDRLEKDLEVFRRNVGLEADEGMTGKNAADLAADKLDDLRRMEAELQQAKDDAAELKPPPKKKETTEEEREYRAKEIDEAFEQGGLIPPGAEDNRSFEEKKQKDLFGGAAVEAPEPSPAPTEKPANWTEDMWNEYQAGNLTVEEADRLIAARPKMEEEGRAQAAARQAARKDSEAPAKKSEGESFETGSVWTRDSDGVQVEIVGSYTVPSTGKTNYKVRFPDGKTRSMPESVMRKRFVQAESPAATKVTLTPAARRNISGLRDQLYSAETEEDIDNLREEYERQKDDAGGAVYKSFDKDGPWEAAKKRLRKTGTARPDPAKKRKTDLEKGIEAGDLTAIVRQAALENRIYYDPEINTDIQENIDGGNLNPTYFTNDKSKKSSAQHIDEFAEEHAPPSLIPNEAVDSLQFLLDHLGPGKYVFHEFGPTNLTKAQEKEYEEEQERKAREEQKEDIARIKAAGLGDRLSTLEGKIGKLGSLDIDTADYVIDLALSDERSDLRKAREKFEDTASFKNADKKQREKLDELYDAAIEEVERIVESPSEADLFGFAEPFSFLISRIGKFVKETFGERSPGAGKVHIPDSIKGKDGETVKEIIERKRAARRGAVERGLAARVLDALKKAKHQFRSSFKYLQEGDPETALIVDLLRQYRGAPSLARAIAYDATRNITEGLSPEEMVVMTDYFALGDIIKDVEDGLYDDATELPFGYSHKKLGDNYKDAADIEKEFKVIEAIVNDPENSRIKDAIEKRQRFVRKIAKKMVSLDILSADVLEGETYFHRQVLEYLNAPQDAKWIGAGGGADAHMRKKSFQMRRAGGSDFSLAYHEAEYEYISQAISQISKAETLNRLKQMSDIAPELAEQAKQQNLDAYLLDYAEKEAKRASNEELFQKDPIDILRDIRENPQKSPLWGFTVQIAKANAQLAKAAVEGKLPAVGFDEVVEDLADAYREHLWVKEEIDDDAPFYFDHPDWFKWLAALAEERSIGFKEDPGPILAAQIFRAISERRETIKKTLGDKYATWETLAKEKKKDGWEIWQPKEGFHFFIAPTIPERVLEQVIAGSKTLEKSDLRDVMARGGKRESWVIPKALASELDEWATPEKGGIDGFARAVNTAWKQWTLLSPMRAIRYNLNNMSGDLDITIAYDPKIALKYGHQAAKDLVSYNKGKASKALEKEIQDGIKRGVIDSGLSVYEIPDISKTAAFSALVDPGNNPNKLQRIVRGYWRGVKGFTTWRENVLRLAAYRYFQDRIAAGDKVYGASSKKTIDAMERDDDMAAKLARELIGDYGNVSRAGQFMRDRLMPFYSWIEINAPRYARMMRNASSEGRKGAAARKAAGAAVRGGMKLGGLYLRAHILYALVAASNKLFFPDEDRQINKNRNQFHLIVGRDAKGVPISIRFEGALADALEWFDLEDYPQDIRDLLSGEKDFADLGAEAVKAPINRALQAWEPFSKTTFELALGKSIFPSVFQKGKSFGVAGRPIRSRWEHLARTFSMDWLYRMVSRHGDKPIPRRPSVQLFPGDPVVGKFLQATLLYRTDPGEAAYWYTKHLAIKWKREKSSAGDPGSFVPSERSNALYYYKTAVRWGDDESAAAWLEEYKRLGGTAAGLKQSIDRADPLDVIKGADERRKFFNSLTREDRDEVSAAIKWYNKTYRGNRGRP